MIEHDLSKAPLPIRARVIIRRDPPETATAAGLVIPNGEKPPSGRVVAVHRGKHSKSGALIPCGVEVGQRVLFGKYSGSDIQGASIGYPELGLLVVMPEDEILGVIEEE